MNVKNLLVVVAFVFLGAVTGIYGSRLLASLRPAPELPVEEGNFASYVDGSASSLALFSTSTCPFCKKTRAYLDEHQIPYHDYVIDKSEQASLMYKQFGDVGVPVLVTARHKIVGFSPKSIDKMLVMDGVKSIPH